MSDSTKDVERDLARVDWAATPLGPSGSWPQSLRSAVRIMLSSRFAMWLAWGPQLTFMCNDAYRRDTLGNKYPWALGRPARDVWAEIWPDIGPRIEHVMATGEATWDEALLLFLERSGYREETYHTFSYSPLTDDDGVVVGMLCVVSEETERVVGAARMAIVRDLGAAVTGLRTEAEVLDVAQVELSRAQAALPFTAVYLLEPDGSATLARTSALPPGTVASPIHLSLTDGASPWPLTEVAAGRASLVALPRERFGQLPTGGWEHPPTQALVVPFRQQEDVAPLGFLVAGLNPFRPADADCRGFVELLAGQVAGALASARAYEEERDRVQRLQELDSAKTAFFTNVSHEFRTPLTLMLGPAEDALADSAHPLDPAQRARVEIIERNGERLLRLVNTLLDFSRLQAGRLAAQFEPVDLALYTRELAAAFSAAVQRAGLTLTVDCPPLETPVHVDREMWAQIVLNLLSNALKFTFSGGITVRLRQEGEPVAAGGPQAVAQGGWVRLDVIDSGVGIAPEEQGRLFERFTRVAGVAARSHEGSGIGLALVADLAAAHGGGAGVASSPGAGSTFSVRLPLGSAHLPADQVVAAEPVTPRAPEPSRLARSARGFLAEALRWIGARSDDDDGGGGGASGTDGAALDASGERARVLVADDNADMREYVARLLADDYEVLLAADGREALRCAVERHPDLVLSDVMMPHLDGFALLRALRADPVTAQVPVVLLSARAGEEATVEGLDAGADDYLAKPFSGRELLARVRANLELERSRRTRRDLERSQALLDQAQRLAGVGSWEADLATGEVTASEELARQLQVTDEEIREWGLDGVVSHRVHPDDRERVTRMLHDLGGVDHIDYEQRLVTPDGQTRTYRARGTVERDDSGVPVRLRGSNQDVTEQRAAERAVAEAAASAEAAAREHSIADELQRSLLPATDAAAEALRVAAYYRAGVEGTQVGGDWFDVVPLGADRTALVLGDVMGRGVRAAAVMGQLRSAVRAYASLDLAPADVVEHLDAIVRDLGEDQIVTCVYAVFDPHGNQLVHANAGHLPPLVRRTDGTVVRLPAAGGPPLGAGGDGVVEHTVQLAAGDVLALYTDGLVERRDDDIDRGVDALARHLADLAGPLDRQAPDRLVAALLPQGPDDDVAVLLAQVDDSAAAVMTRTIELHGEASQVAPARRSAAALLREWGVTGPTVDDVLLCLSELMTNAVVYGRPPVQVRLRRGRRSVTVEVDDRAMLLPRRLRPHPDDEHGRGLQMVSRLATRWGVRPTTAGKAVWATFTLPQA